MFAKSALRKPDDGGSTVETALSMILMLTVLFGIVEIAFALYTYHFISEAAREGTRYAIVRGSSSTTTYCPTASGCPATAADVSGYVEGLEYPGINPADMTVSTIWPDGNAPGDPVAVTVQYQFPLTVPFIPKKTFSLSSTSQMIISQ